MELQERLQHMVNRVKVLQFARDGTSHVVNQPKTPVRGGKSKRLHITVIIKKIIKVLIQNFKMF